MSAKPKDKPAPEPSGLDAESARVERHLRELDEVISAYINSSIAPPGDKALTDVLRDAGALKGFKIAVPLLTPDPDRPGATDQVILEYNIDLDNLFQTIYESLARLFALQNGWISETEPGIPPAVRGRLDAWPNAKIILKASGSVYSFLYLHLPRTMSHAYRLLGGAALAHLDFNLGFRSADISIDKILASWATGENQYLNSLKGRPPAWTKAELDREIKKAVRAHYKASPYKPSQEKIAKRISKSNPERVLTASALRQLMKRKGLNWKELQKRS